MPFEKGKSANPGGRRKEKKARDALVMALLDAGEDMPRLRTVWNAILKKAEEGDVAAAREIFDRLDGKVPQAIVGDDGEDPVNVSVTRIERIIVDPTNTDG
jgi:hypothetical protein